MYTYMYVDKWRWKLTDVHTDRYIGNKTDKHIHIYRNKYEIHGHKYTRHFTESI